MEPINKTAKQITEFSNCLSFGQKIVLNALAGGCVRGSKSRQAYLESSDLEERIELVTNGLADAQWLSWMIRCAW